MPTAAHIDAELAAIEARVPALLQDRNEFPRAFEALTAALLSRTPREDWGRVLDGLADIVRRSGFNGA